MYIYIYIDVYTHTHIYGCICMLMSMYISKCIIWFKTNMHLYVKLRVVTNSRSMMIVDTTMRTHNTPEIALIQRKGDGPHRSLNSGRAKR